MSRPVDDREGLSPSPSQVLDDWQDESENDDIYVPASEEGETTSNTNDDTSESDFADAQESLNGIEIIFPGEGGDEDEEEDEDTETEAPAAQTEGRTAQVTISEINQLLGSHGPLRRLLLSRYRLISPTARNIIDEDEDDDDYESSTYGGFQRRRRRRPKPAGDRFPKVPSEAGKDLMDSGLYGSRDSHVDQRRKRRRTFSERLMWRRLGVDARSSLRRQNRLIAQELVPSNTIADRIIHYDSRAYSGQFSDDGNFFFSCTQNFKVRMYDTSNPYDWKYYKTVDYPFGQWTITDATLSPDNKYLAYSSIRHFVCLAPTDPTDHSDHTLLDLTNFAPGAGQGGRSNYGYMGRNGFGIWSLRFSGDGREIVAGTSDHSVVVYDLERRQSTVRLSNHHDDVNAVCFGDNSSPHILYSGSDDQTLRVWDRRSMADGREAGVFVGHTEGLTYVDSKGDGRYVLSNGKDQMMKLWDLRKMISTSDFSKIDMRSYTSNFDYRFSPYDDDDYIPNPHDCSVVTFRGHSVLKTLIRCHFSPPTSSNSRYVYTGSEDGKVWVYSMDGKVKAKIDVAKATKNSRPKTNGGGESYGYELHGHHSSTWKTCVRDASWSPTAPLLAATSWNGWGMATGTVTVHSWHDPPPSSQPPNLSPAYKSVFARPYDPNEIDYDAFDAATDDADEPPMAASYNARLDLREDFMQAAAQRRRERDVGGAGGLRSSVVRPRRYGAEDQDGDGGGW